ncbi:hypothetical protein TNCV_942451 [Trichonephila clavipes]|nr:hypothetical protein TNCV_942451 [Trichonephila clavipes]
MTLARFRNGHLRGMTFVHGVKSYLYLLIFWTAGAFPCDSCLKIKTWCVILLCGNVKLTCCGLFYSKEIGNNNKMRYCPVVISGAITAGLQRVHCTRAVADPIA